MVRISIFLLLFTTLAAAEECVDSTLYSKTDGSKVQLCYDKKLKNFVSFTCLKICQARSFLIDTTLLSNKDLEGGKDPHSVACTKVGGGLFLYRDGKQNEYAFCEAGDGSAVSADSIKFTLK